MAEHYCSLGCLCRGYSCLEEFFSLDLLRAKKAFAGITSVHHFDITGLVSWLCPAEGLSF